MHTLLETPSLHYRQRETLPERTEKASCNLAGTDRKHNVHDQPHTR